MKLTKTHLKDENAQTIKKQHKTDTPSRIRFNTILYASQICQQFKADKGCLKYKTNYQLVAFGFGQLGKCYTLTNISCSLSISSTFMIDLGLKQNTVKSTMSDGKKNSDYWVFEDVYYQLFSISNTFPD